MSIVNTLVQTIRCDAPGCEKFVTFAQSQAEETIKANPWLKNVRIVGALLKEHPQAPDKSFTYCSDICEVEGVKTQKHNYKEPNLIQMPSGDQLAAVRAAAQAAEAARTAEIALREGAPVSIQPATH